MRIEKLRKSWRIPQRHLRKAILGSKIVKLALISGIRCPNMRIDRRLGNSDPSKQSYHKRRTPLTSIKCYSLSSLTGTLRSFIILCAAIKRRISKFNAGERIRRPTVALS